MFGFLNINKPSGITSHKVISVLRKITGIKQIGHSGTLDPLAQGVLPVAIGKASRLIEYLNEDKCYIVTMKLGFVSNTYDIEGDIENTGSKKATLEQVKEVIKKFQGSQTQIPPVFSAVHYNGKRLYELARNGIIPDDIPSRKIIIYKNKLINFDYENQILELEISCSKGTYIRSIVNDTGIELKTGAIMSKLIRTVSSGMKLSDSLILTENLTKEDISNNLINPKNLLNLNCIEINENDYKKVINGNKFTNKTDYSGDILLTKENKIIALASADSEYIQPKKVLT